MFGKRGRPPKEVQTETPAMKIPEKFRQQYAQPAQQEEIEEPESNWEILEIAPTERTFVIRNKATGEQLNSWEEIVDFLNGSS